jgi:tetratricopeptide (TPR) repeat protein
LKLEPKNAAVWNNLGICYKKLEQFDMAISAFQKAVEQNAGQMLAYFNLGEVQSKLGDFAAASQNYEKALMVSPPAMKTLICDKIAYAYFMQKQYKLALRAIDTALQFAPNDPALLQYLKSRREKVMRAAEAAQP